MRREIARELAIHLLYQLDLRGLALKDIKEFCEETYQRCISGDYSLITICRENDNSATDSCEAGLSSMNNQGVEDSSFDLGQDVNLEHKNKKILEIEADYFESAEGKLERKDFDYTDHLLKSTVDNLEMIDDLIAGGLKAWSMDRLARIEMAIMRIALCEFIILDIPTPVAINEALRLAEKLSDDSSKSYINAILGKVSRESGLANKGRLNSEEND